MTQERAAGLEGTLTTKELLARIDAELGLKFHPSAIRHWIAREERPLPVAYKGKSGQSHRFDWVAFLEWYEGEEAETAPGGEGGADDIDRMDWHGARTISARAQAKKDVILARKVEGRYGDVPEMRRTAEDRARQAVLALRGIPSRLAPKLALVTDEIEIDLLLDQEIRAVCQEIEEAALQAMEQELPDIEE